MLETSALNGGSVERAARRSIGDELVQGSLWARRWFARRGLGTETAEDLAQDVVLRFWCHYQRHGYTPGLSARALWRHAARLRFTEYLRAHHRAGGAAQGAPAPVGVPRPDQTLLAREALSQLSSRPAFLEVSAHALGTSDTELARRARQSAVAIRQRRRRFRAAHDDWRHEPLVDGWLAEGCSQRSAASLKVG